MVTRTKNKTKPPSSAPDTVPVRISQAQKVTGVNKRTIEYYVMLGLIQPIRPDGGRGRLFDAELLRRIKLIYELNRSGYTLRDIRETYLSGQDD